MRGGAQRSDHVRVPGVEFAAVDIAIQAAVLDRHLLIPGPARQRLLISLQFVEASALDAADRAGEATLDDLIGQTDQLEKLRPTVAGNGRDAHFRKNLEQALADAAAVGTTQLQRFIARIVDLATGGHCLQGLVDQVGVDRGGAEADQAGDLVRIARGAGLDDQVAVGPLAGLDQVMVDRAGGQQGMDRQLAALKVAVRKQQQVAALGDRSRGALAQLGQSVPQREINRDVQIQQHRRQTELRRIDQLAQLALRQHRRVQHHPPGQLRPGFEYVTDRTDHGLQRHHDALAQGIDRRIGDLSELLPTAIIQRPDPGREHRHRRIVAHRSDRLGLGLGEHANHLASLLAREVEHLLEGCQGVGIERLGRHVNIDQLRVQVAHTVPEPVLPGMQRFQLIVDAVGIMQFAGFQIGRQQLARAQPAARSDLVNRQIDDAGFRGDDQAAIGGQSPACRAQAVAVQPANHPASVAHHQPCRAIPGFLVEAEEFMEGPQVGIEVVGGLPGRRHQDAQCLRQRHAAHHQQLQHVVQ